MVTFFLYFWSCSERSLMSGLSCSVGFFAETARKGTVVSRANSIGSTSASSVPNTGIMFVTEGGVTSLTVVRVNLSYILDCDVHVHVLACALLGMTQSCQIETLPVSILSDYVE